MKKEIQNMLETLATVCLSQEQAYQRYTDTDLTNATLIFNHIFGDVLFTENYKKLTTLEMFDLAETSGKAFAEFIKKTTGKDMKNLVEKL